MTKKVSATKQPIKTGAAARPRRRLEPQSPCISRYQLRKRVGPVATVANKLPQGGRAKEVRQHVLGLPTAKHIKYVSTH